MSRFRQPIRLQVIFFAVVLSFADYRQGHTSIIVEVALRGELVISKGRLYFVQEPGSLTVIDLHSGQVIHRVKTDSSGFGGKVVPTERDIALVQSGIAHLLDTTTMEVVFAETPRHCDASENWVAVTTPSHTLDNEKPTAFKIYDRQNRTWREVVRDAVPLGWHVNELLMREEFVVLQLSRYQSPRHRVLTFDVHTGSKLSDHIDADNNVTVTAFGKQALFQVVDTGTSKSASGDALGLKSSSESELPTSKDFRYVRRPYSDLSAQKALMTTHSGYTCNNGLPAIFESEFIAELEYPFVRVFEVTDQNRERFLASLEEEVVRDGLSYWRETHQDVTLLSSLVPDYENAEGRAFQVGAQWQRLLPKHLPHTPPHIGTFATDLSTNSLVIGTNDGRVECIDLDSGSPRWLYTFPHSYSFLSINGGYIGPYKNREEAEHHQRMLASREVGGSVGVGFGEHPLERFRASISKPYTASIIWDPQPDLLYPSRLSQVAKIRKFTWALVGAMVLAGVVLMLSKRDFDTAVAHGIIHCLVGLLMAATIHGIASRMWYYHRLDESLTWFMKGSCLLCAIGMLVLTGYQLKRKRWVPALVLGVALISVGYNHWFPIILP